MEIYLTTEEAFNLFLKEFTEQLQKLSTSLNEASWTLETDGSKQAAEQVAEKTKALNTLFCDKEMLKKLEQFKQEGSITSPRLLRVLNRLIKRFKDNQVPEDLIEKIAQLEAKLSHIYVEHRALLNDQSLTENEILKQLRTEKDPKKRQELWNASKQIGPKMAPTILQLVKLRNQKAHRLGYTDYFQMQLVDQEIDKNWLFDFLNQFEKESNDAYLKVYHEIENELSDHFQVAKAALGPWAWADPFSQENPVVNPELDELVQSIDFVPSAIEFFDSLGFDVRSILESSDLYERDQKNQHAFCTHIDRGGDIRVLMNIHPTLKSYETLLHELGHAVYEQGYDPTLPWILKQPPHMITTEAIALMMGRHAYDPLWMHKLNPETSSTLLDKLHEHSRRSQLIFSRWVLVIIHFEAALYQNPEQNLNQLWWTLVQKYQKICPPSHRSGEQDWASKYHIGLAPVYYHSYLLGEFFASMLLNELRQKGASLYGDENTAPFLNDKLFFPADSYRWNQLIQQVVQKPLSYNEWIAEFSVC